MLVTPPQESRPRVAVDRETAWNDIVLASYLSNRGHVALPVLLYVCNKTRDREYHVVVQREVITPNVIVE